MQGTDDTGRPLDVDRLMEDLRARAHEPTHGRPLFEPGPEELHVKPREIVAESPRAGVGPVVTKGKRLIARTMQPILDDLAQQVNDSLDHLVALRADIDALRERVDESPDLEPRLGEITTRLEALEQLGIAARLARVEAAAATVPGTAAPDACPPVDAHLAAVAAARARIDDCGDERLAAYWAVIDPAQPVLDLSWSADAARHLHKLGVAVRSVHPDATTVEERRQAGVAAELGDPLAAIAEAPAESLGGIVALGLGDHLSQEQWMALPRRAHQALAPGGGLVLEMVNSTTPAAQALRSRDPSLTAPVHPDTVAFLLRTAGFTDVEVRYLGAFPDDQGAPIAPDPDWFQRQVNEMAAVINRLVVGQPIVAVLARR